jgi:pilus assembly protein Flp/PilA
MPKATLSETTHWIRSAGLVPGSGFDANIASRTEPVRNLLLKLKIWVDTKGQDLIEYALMAGFVAVAAGAIMPGVSTSISKIFSQVGSVLTKAKSTGS